MESSKKLVVFDVDGTLNKTETYALSAYKQAAIYNNIDFIACRYGYCQPNEFTEEDNQVYSAREIPDIIHKITFRRGSGQ